MKKICLFSVAFLLACAVHAQTVYSVPTPTMEQKFNSAIMHFDNTTLAQITVAKNNGMTPSELGKRIGEVFIPAWDENGGFEPFVQFIINGWACLGEGVQIIDQSDKRLVVMVSSLYRPVEDQGVLFGSSVKDLTAYFDAMLNEIATHYGKSLEMTWGEEGYRVEIAL